MKGLINWWARNSVAANLMMVAIIIMGVVGFFKLEREFFPTVIDNSININVTWLGASPTDVEDQILTRIEDAVAGIDGIDYVSSYASESFGSVTITTKVRADYDRLLTEIKTRVDGINQFPPDAFKPSVVRGDKRADYMYLALYGDVGRLALQRKAKEIRDEMAKLSGGELTKDLTKIDEEITIEIDEDNLRRYGLTFSQVSRAISGSSVNLSAGNVKTSAGNLQLKARNLADTKEDFGKIIIRQSKDGGTVYLRDIAKIKDGFDDIDFVASYKGKDAVMFQVRTPDRINVTKAGIAFRHYAAEKNHELEHMGMQLELGFDGSTVFDARMNLIGSNALMGMALVLVILLLFLRPIVAFWVTIGILVSFAGALAVMPMLGVSFNMISTFAILLVIGIVVDDAIVVGESIHFHVEHGVEGPAAAVAGTRMVLKPVFFAVVTTIMTFLPWMLLSGPMVTITRQITLVVMAALLFSMLEAFFILPAHLAHMKKQKATNNPLLRFQRKLADGLTLFAHNSFRPIIATTIRHRWITFFVFVGLFIFSISGLIGSGMAKIEMFTNPAGDMIMSNITFPEGTSYKRVKQVKDRLDKAAIKVNENAKKDFDVDFDLITSPFSFAWNNRVQAFMGLAKAEKRDLISSKDIAEKLEEYLGPVPDAYRINISADQGFSQSGGRSVRYGITSADPKQLEAATQALRTHLESYGSVTRSWSSLESSAQEMRFTLLPGAERYGLTLSDVTRQVREAFFGREVQRLPRNGEDVRVVLRYPKAARDSIDTLKSLRIRTNNGTEVPLYSVAKVSYAPGITSISRRDRKRVVRVGARVKGGPEEIARIKRDMKQNFLPEWDARFPKVSQLVIGDDDKQNTMLSELKLYGVMILLMMYGLLAIAFKSYTQPFLIMIAIPFAFVGMVFGSVIMNVPLGMMSAFGFFAAAGVAVNDNLVLIDYVNRLRTKGVGAYQAMLDACVSRFRPILLTSVTTFVGIMPMFAEKSVQAQFLKPMVVALAFGVLFDFFLTLLLVPAMYGMGVDIKRLIVSIWKGKRQPPFGSTYDPDIAIALEDAEIEDIIQEAETLKEDLAKIHPAQ